jgi:hypothetical protein
MICYLGKNKTVYYDFNVLINLFMFRSKKSKLSFYEQIYSKYIIMPSSIARSIWFFMNTSSIFMFFILCDRFSCFFVDGIQLINEGVFIKRNNKSEKCFEGKYVVFEILLLISFIILILVQLILLISFYFKKFRYGVSYESNLTSKFTIKEIYNGMYRIYKKKFLNVFLILDFIKPYLIASFMFFGKDFEFSIAEIVYISAIILLYMVVYLIFKPYYHIFDNFTSFFFNITLISIFATYIVYSNSSYYWHTETLIYFICSDFVVFPLFITFVFVSFYIGYQYFFILKGMKDIGYIDKKHINFNKIIGSGSFGIVYKGSVAYLPVAIKRIEYSGVNEDFINELKIAKICDHKNITSLIGWSRDEKYWYLIFEIIEGNTLNLKIRRRFKNVVDE